jgi:NADPH2:quinone reductase
MHAAWYVRNGPAAEVLSMGELADPELGPGEVRVRLHASGVNPSDVKARAGNRKVMWERVIPDSDGAGVIDGVGAGVDASRVGQRVWIYNGQWERPYGTSAQYITLSSALAPPLPEGLSYEEGACLGIPVMTAHRCVFADGPVAGKTVLVTGGAGVVGHYAIQLARWGGARVIATVSSAAKAEHARAAGADHVINYRTENVVDRVRALTGGVDRIVEVDLGVNLPVSAEILNPFGGIAAYATAGKPVPELPYQALLRKNPTLRLVFVYTMPDEAKVQAIADIERWAREAKPQFAIAARFSLDQVVAAHQTVERGEKIGHVLLSPL